MWGNTYVVTHGVSLGKHIDMVDVNQTVQKNVGESY